MTPPHFYRFFRLPLMQYICGADGVHHYIFSLKTVKMLGTPYRKRSYIVLLFSYHFFRYDHKQKS